MVFQFCKGVLSQSLSCRELAMNSPKDTTRVTLWAGGSAAPRGPPGAGQRASEPCARCLAEKDPAKLNQLGVSRLWKKLNLKCKGFYHF